MNQRKASPEELRVCLKITENLMKHPIASMFLRPVDTKADNAPDYYFQIKNPQDLGTIKRRLEEKNYYRYVSDWERDMNCVWANCIQYNGETSYLADFSREMKRLFEKMITKVRIRSYEGWINRIQDLFEEIDDSLKHSPHQIGLQFAYKPLSSPMNRTTIEKFIRAANGLTSKDDILHLIQLAALNGAAFEQRRDDAIIDLSTVKESGIRQLVKYTKDRYAENHMIYPE
ncbi:Bromodomain containing protein [Tritrichomonas foetus]|uniref:Bromodomain containing protein n=1 Tax=Tritrichomonas foetus TaxID=1144522 RepID=A0A1J4K2L6_9EUKA|nr:Bromodomain containing protein [Tritrichomonas foetus]|eukprot:OHT05210.1 Bromodomain containing protein [Tritrichomonas foetus]